MADIPSRLKLRRSTAALWNGANPTLLDGEPGVETDVSRVRIGDGSTAFISLRAFLSVPIGAIAAAQAFLNAVSVSAQREALELSSHVTSDLTGEVAFFGRNSAPDGWLKANGAAISRTTYSELFAAIGTTFGTGDGSTTFNLPDLRGEFPRGWDDSRGVDSGRAFGSAQGELLKNHTHSGTTGDGGVHNHTPGAGGAFLTNNGGPVYGAGSGNLSASGTTDNSDPHTHPFTTGNPNGGLGGAETRPRNIALLACIKY